MFGAFTGTVGTGKTLSMVWKAYGYYKRGYKIFSNIDLNFPHVKVETLEDLENVRGTAEQPAIAIFDELWRWLDSRQYKKAKNDFVSRTIFYSRKRYVDVYYTTQRFHQIEKRIRDLTDAEIKPELSAKRRVMFQGRSQVLPIKCTLFYHLVEPKSNGLGYEISKKPAKIERFITLPVMALYNTREEVLDL